MILVTPWPTIEAVQLARRCMPECFLRQHDVRGATAPTSTTIKTYLCGIYWGAFECSINAPQERSLALNNLENQQPMDVAKVIACLEQVFSNPETGYRHYITAEQLPMMIST
jgi:hypothetical protein